MPLRRNPPEHFRRSSHSSGSSTQTSSDHHPGPKIDTEECEEHLQELWAILLEFPGQAPGRVKMVADLILCIARLHPVLTQPGEQLAVDDGFQRVWQDVSTLGWALREEWHCGRCLVPVS